MDDERLRLLRGDIFRAAGGTHDDWPTYDRMMRRERRTTVLVTAARLREPGMTAADRRPVSRSTA